MITWNWLDKEPSRRQGDHGEAVAQHLQLLDGSDDVVDADVLKFLSH
jgi:hypothetical protein